MGIVIDDGCDHNERQYSKDHARILEHAKRCTRVIPMDNTRIRTEPFQGVRQPGSALRDVGTYQHFVHWSSATITAAIVAIGQYLRITLFTLHLASKIVPF